MLKAIGGILVGGCWLALTTCGLVKAAQYDSKPQEVVAVASQFPASSSIQLASSAPTVVLFLHPECPCSKATLHALGEAQARSASKANVYVVFVKPPGLRSNSETTDLEKLARTIENATILDDPECKEATRFNATTSGQCFVYSAKGELRFSGGLTRARGHYGDSSGREALLSIFEGKSPDYERAPVFGCSLR